MNVQACVCTSRPEVTIRGLYFSPLIFLRQDLPLHLELSHSARIVGH